MKGQITRLNGIFFFGQLSTNRSAKFGLHIVRSKVFKVAFIVFLCSITSFIIVNNADRIHHRQPYSV